MDGRRQLKIGDVPMKFTYNSGQRPLDGYTLKRGIGRGGFGEVFYALSDGGKEVALKLVHGNNLDVELRGMAQCLNLKHPNLLALFDIRSDAQGDHWVVMEYIAGEPLSAVLNRHPDGLAPSCAQQWFLTLACGGPSSRTGSCTATLKPANIFLENGTVKIGDYGRASSSAAASRAFRRKAWHRPLHGAGNLDRQPTSKSTSMPPAYSLRDADGPRAVRG